MLKQTRLLYFSTALAAVLLTTRVLADTVILKGGERIDGKILSETDTEITIQYNVTASIKDDRTVKKTDVEKVEKAAPDIEAWAIVKDFKLGEDSLDPATYAHYITALKGFVAQFPESASAAPAKATIEAIEAEKKRVDAGEFKFDGKWLSKEEVQKERVQVLGNSYLRQLKKYAAAGRAQDAMVTFEQLEKVAVGSAAYPDAVEIARRTLIALKGASDAALARLKAQMDEEKRTLEKLNDFQKMQTKNELESLRKRTAANVDAIERSGVKWMPLSPATEKSLVGLSSKASSELSRINGLDVDKMRQSLKEVDKAKVAVAAGDFAAAEAAYAKAGQFWNNNEQVQRGITAITVARKAEADKMAADKIAAAAAAEAAKIALEDELQKNALTAVKPTPAPAPVAAVEEEPKKEASFFSKPAAWVILAVLIAFGALIRKALHKFKDPSGNILDQ